MSRATSARDARAAFRVAAGDALPPVVRHVTQDMINAYANASGDFNPIHVDPAFAKTGPFGRTIAHGLMTLAFVSQVLNEWSDGRFDASGEIDIAFVGPVFVGDTIEISGKVEDVSERDGVLVARVEVWCLAGERKILAGIALQPIEHGKP